MSEAEPPTNAWRGLTLRHVKITLLGLLVILVPITIVAKSVEHAHEVVQQGVTKITPAVEQLGGFTTTAVILFVLLIACWILGLILVRTELGRQWVEWEKAKFFTRSPLLQKQDKRLKSKQDGDTEPSPPARPALVRIEGGWQPGVVVEEQTDSWVTVFLPDIPSTSTGRLLCLPASEVMQLDVPLEDFRKQLTATGHGSQAWLRALSAAKPEAAETNG